MTAPLFFDEPFLRRLETLALLYRQAARSPLPGERRSAQRGHSVEFSDFRPYTLGDDFRRIDWNAYARMERLFIKLFVEEVDLPVTLVMDASRSMDWGAPNKLDFAIRLAAALGYIALAGSDRLTVWVLSAPQPGLRHLPPIRGKRSAITLFSFLDALRSNGDRTPHRRHPPLEFLSLAGELSTGGPLLLLSDLMDDRWQEGLNRLAARKFEITLLHILAPDELEPPLEGDFQLIDSETQASVEISANFETLEQYRRALNSWQREWRQFCALRQMHYIPVNTSQPLEELLFAALPQQRVLQ